MLKRSDNSDEEDDDDDGDGSESSDDSESRDGGSSSSSDEDDEEGVHGDNAQGKQRSLSKKALRQLDGVSSTSKSSTLPSPRKSRARKDPVKVSRRFSTPARRSGSALTALRGEANLLDSDELSSGKASPPYKNMEVWNEHLTEADFQEALALNEAAERNEARRNSQGDAYIVGRDLSLYDEEEYDKARQAAVSQGKNSELDGAVTSPTSKGQKPAVKEPAPSTQEGKSSQGFRPPRHDSIVTRKRATVSGTSATSSLERGMSIKKRIFSSLLPSSSSTDPATSAVDSSATRTVTQQQQQQQQQQKADEQPTHSSTGIDQASNSQVSSPADGQAPSPSRVDTAMEAHEGKNKDPPSPGDITESSLSTSMMDSDMFFSALDVPLDAPPPPQTDDTAANSNPTTDPKNARVTSNPSSSSSSSSSASTSDAEADDGDEEHELF